MKFNQTNSVNSNVTTNIAGGSAYKIDDVREKLALQVLSSFVSEEKYYGDNTDDIIKNMDELCTTLDGIKFLRNLGLYARKEFNMRSISHLIAAKLASVEMNSSITRNYVADVCIRPDDMLEIVSVHKMSNNNKVASCIKKGIAEAIHKFDEYQLSKYRGKKKSLKIKDLINIAHPIPRNNNESALFKSILEDTITTPMTWEVEISKIKKDDVLGVKAAWEKLIFAKNEKGMYTLGIMALIRNLANILKANVSDEAISLVCSRLMDKKTIVNSKQFPFRFYSAYKVINDGFKFDKVTPDVAKVLGALEVSIELAIDNMPKFEGKTCLIVDESGSMNSTMSGKSSVTARELANLFAAICVKMSDDVTVIPFGEVAKVMYLSPRDSIFTNMKKLERSGVGYATYLNEAISLIQDIEFDRIIVFSDFQTYSNPRAITSYYLKPEIIHSYETYSKTFPNVKYHSLDLMGYGTSIANPRNPNVNLYGGFSEKTLQLMQLAEAGVSSLVKEIENY